MQFHQLESKTFQHLSMVLRTTELEAPVILGGSWRRFHLAILFSYDTFVFIFLLSAPEIVKLTKLSNFNYLIKTRSNFFIFIFMVKVKL